MIRYTGTLEEDILLSTWWTQLMLSGDWEKCFLTPRTGLSHFYAHFLRDTPLFYVERRGKVGVAAWIEPSLVGSTFFSLWIAPEYRGSRFAVKAAKDIFTHLFTTYQVILSITTQESLLDLYRKIGYTVIGQIQGLGNGQSPVWLLSLTAQGFRGGQLCKVESSAEKVLTLDQLQSV